MTVGCQRI